MQEWYAECDGRTEQERDQGGNTTPRKIPASASTGGTRAGPRQHLPSGDSTDDLDGVADRDIRGEISLTRARISTVKFRDPPLLVNGCVDIRTVAVEEKLSVRLPHRRVLVEDHRQHHIVGQVERETNKPVGGPYQRSHPAPGPMLRS